MFYSEKLLFYMDNNHYNEVLRIRELKYVVGIYKGEYYDAS